MPVSMGHWKFKQADSADKLTISIKINTIPHRIVLITDCLNPVTSGNAQANAIAW
jgi:hypothetical protein